MIAELPPSELTDPSVGSVRVAELSAESLMVPVRADVVAYSRSSDESVEATV